MEEATAGVEQGVGASRGRGQQRAETGKPRNKWTDRATADLSCEGIRHRRLMNDSTLEINDGANPLRSV